MVKVSSVFFLGDSNPVDELARLFIDELKKSNPLINEKIVSELAATD